MMQLATWLSVLILGPGSVAVFVWFLVDVKRIFGSERADSEQGAKPQAVDEV
jgi:hypothetical protein